MSMDENICRENIINDLDRNMFVEAGAGAGKTYLIVERIMNLLANGRKPGEIVVITFTNAAAEELRERISKKVRQNADLKEALRHLDEMNISTIHSFCNVLLKEQAVAAHLPVDMTLIDEKEDLKLKRHFLNTYLAGLDAGEWDRMEKVYRPEGKNRYQISNHIEGIYLGILSQADDVRIVNPKQASEAEGLNRLNQYVYSPDKAYVDAKIKSISDKIVDLTKTVAPETATIKDLADNDELASSDAKRLFDVITGVNIENSDKMMMLIDIALKGGGLWKKGGVPKDKKDAVDTINQQWKEYIRKEFDDILDLDIFKGAGEIGDIQKNVWFLMLTQHAVKAAQLYRQKRPVDRVSNDRLLWLTKDLICNDEDDSALRYFAGKYRAFFVDEFQDTDSVQADFIYRLASDPDDVNHEKLRDGALFVVGDPKQSIYRFRGAQPEIYFDIKDRMKKLSNANVYELTFNFRTNEVLIDWINEKFEQADKEAFYIVDKVHQYAPMKAQKKVAKEDDKLICGAYRYTKPDSLGETVEVELKTKTNTEYYPAAYTLEQDVKDVVSLIKNLIEKEYKITDYKEENGERTEFARPVKASDFLLITHMAKYMEPYITALKAAGIPVRFAGQSSLAADTILITFMRIFRHLINPREPFYRVSAIEAIRESHLVDVEEDMDEYADDLLDLLRDKVSGMTPYGTAQYLEGQLSAILPKGSDLSSIDINASRTRIRQMLEYLYANSEGTGIKLIKDMEDYIADGVDHELSLEETPDAVNFMNLHKTKGLEGKIVIIADRQELGWDEKVAAYRNGNDYYPGYRNNNECWSTVIGDDDLEAKYVEESRAEFHRLEYVAVTRAEQAVIFMNTIKPRCIFANQKIDKKQGAIDGFDYKLCELPSIEDCIDDSDNTRAPEVKDGYDPSRDDLFTDNSSSSEESENRHRAVYEKLSPSLLEIHKESDRKVKKEAISSAKAAGRTSADETSSDMKRPADNKVGNVLHRTMELLIGRFSPDADDKYIKLIAGLCTDQAIRENETDIARSDKYSAEEVRCFVCACAIAYYRWILRSNIMKDVEHVYTELPFSYYEEPEDRKIFMKGNADLMIRYTDGSVRLIDYKSDIDYMIPEDYADKVFEEKYGPQLSAYREMITKLVGVSADRVSMGIVSFSQKDESGALLSGQEVRVRFTEF